MIDILNNVRKTANWDLEKDYFKFTFSSYSLTNFLQLLSVCK